MWAADVINVEMKEKPLRNATGLACAALVASNETKTHQKLLNFG